MKIAIFVNTPAQVHFQKNILNKLIDDNIVYVLARDYGETLHLLNELEIYHHVYAIPPRSKLGKAVTLPFDVFQAFRYLNGMDVDLIVGFGIVEAYTSLLLKTPSVIFNDSEPLTNTKSFYIQFKLYLPLIDVMITPNSFRQYMGAKQIRINSFKELAYIHPKYYHPNNDIFELLGIAHHEDYVLLRFNAFDAVHDLGIGGFSREDKIRLVHELEKYAKVFISSEAGVPSEIKDRVLRIPKSRIHDVIFYAKMLVTDTQTMTTEAALLGTPAVRCNHFVGPNDMGNFVELEKKYGMIFNYRDPDRALNKAVELIQKSNLKKEWNEKRERLLRDKIDITAFMSWFIENYPESFEIMKENPEYQDRFR